MASQPVARPWFRLSSMARPPTQPAPPAQDTQPPPPNPQPRPPILRPTFATAFRPPTAPPPASAPPPPPSPPPPASAPVSAQPPPPPAVPIGATATMPSTPVSRSSNYPNFALGSPASTRIPVTSSSVPSSPTAKTVAPTTNVSPVSNSPLTKISTPSRNSPVIQTAVSSPAKTNSPVPKTVGTVSTMPASAVPNSPASKFTGRNSVPNSSPPKQKSLYSPSASNGGVTTVSVRQPTPSPSPKLTKQPLRQSPPNSPNIKASAPQPSPIFLPPSMLNPDTEMAPKIPIEAEQKSVVTQQTIEKPSSNWVNGNSPKTNPNPSAHHGRTHEKGSHHKKGHNPDENAMRVITIAGENRGAFMELSHSHKKHAHFEGIPHYSLLQKKNGNDSETSSNSDGTSKMKDNNHKNMVNAYMNSNVQGVNNSIVFNSAYTHHDPGVHLSLTRKPNGDVHHKMTQAGDSARHSNGYHS